ncbi:hypothetical protein [Methylobacterium sp. ID0610]|uniref:hypothetical protein n=1 Tax=Methylobacterium carpenticola TaxID=3344827 RepID=UPI0036987EA2
MEDHRAALMRQVRAIDIATGEAASACLPALLKRLARHERGIARGVPLLTLYHRWQHRRLCRAVDDARWHIAQGQAARTGGLLGRR